LNPFFLSCISLSLSFSLDFLFTRSYIET
jgi:hypothetical protein